MELHHFAIALVLLQFIYGILNHFVAKRNFLQSFMRSSQNPPKNVEGNIIEYSYLTFLYLLIGYYVWDSVSLAKKRRASGRMLFNNNREAMRLGS
jgi:hypothetical protein